MDRRLPRSPVLKSPALSPKSPAIYEKYKSGCAWGLIHFFDFRQGHSHRKLISDRKRVTRRAKDDGYKRNRPNSLANERCQHTYDALYKKNLAVNSRKPEVKKVREEEMSVKHQTNKNTAIDEMQNLQANPRLVGHSKDHRKASKNSEKSSHIPAHYGAAEGYRQHSSQNMVDKSSNDKASVTEASCNDVQTNNAANYGGKSIRGSRKYEHHTENPRVHMNEAVEAFVNQKLIDGENLSRNEEANRSKNFIDALEILNSNKELFMKLLQDPNSLLVKHIQGLRDSQAKKQEPQSSSKAQKAPSQPKPGECEPLNTIILLKPGMQNCPDRIGNWPSPQCQHSLRRKERSVRPAFLSFEQVKRKLKHAMTVNKTEQCQMSLEGTYKSQNEAEQFADGGKEISRPVNERISAGNIYLDPVKVAESSNEVHRTDGMGQTENFGPSIGGKAGSSSKSCHTISNQLNLRQLKGKVYPRKHLSEISNRGNEDFSRKQTLRTLDRLMSFPEQDFLPTLTTGMDKAYESASPQMRFSPCSSVSTVNGYKWRVQKEENSACLNSSVKSLGAHPISDTEKPDDRLQGAKTGVSSNLPPAAKEVQTVYSLADDLSQKVDQTSVCPGKVMEKNPSGERNDLGPNVKKNTNTNLRTEAVNISGENEYFECSKLDSPLGDQTSTFPVNVYSSSPLHIQRAEDSKSMTDGAEQPSPISVLEQFFVEDNTSSPSPVSLAAEPPVESYCLDGEELYAFSLMESDMVLKSKEGISTDEQRSLYEYIRAVLQISGVNWDELSRWHFSDQVLDSSWFDNVKIWPDKSCADRRLLFGYISEVLLEIYEYYFRCSPWVLLLKPSPRPVFLSKNAVHEVLRHVDWLLLSELPQQTLQQLVEKDLAKSGVWMDTQIETEEVVTDLVDNILQDLVVEAAIQLQT